MTDQPTAHQRLTRAGISAGFADLVLDQHAAELAEEPRRPSPRPAGAAMTTPADELRAAAAKLRQMRFPAAMTATSSTAALIGARLPLADWLESIAESLDASTHPGWQETVSPHPLAVARAINGTAS